ncbi:centrosomal protein of 290 kDa-like [Pollicipes pollicipes]|uniref:centrosomal protein of 290 kDa-like n=1 Tax=Pollicipes pollicipes TaxID=41117 RepID=UPI001885034E|nr:centrosomal protein of 290 kDa-like [Pollicipes pollicipes]
MGGLDIQQLLKFDISSDLPEDKLEELYSGIDALKENISGELDKDQLAQLVILAQCAMRCKQEQLSVAVEEIEKRAEASGENEELKQRNSELQKLVNKYKSKGADARGVELRTEVEELQAARNQLKKDLKTKQRQLDDEKHETDKLSARVEELEVERRELRRQVEQLNETLDELRRGYDSRSDPEDAGEHQYAELIRQKNQYINVLLDDVEAHEKDKSEMKAQVVSLRDQLSEATRQIEDMTAEFEVFRKQPRPAPRGEQDGSGEAARTIQRLEAQVAELQAVKLRRDRQFDQLSAIVEQRTEEFKRLITGRDTEIEGLQAELRRANVRTTPDVDSDKRRIGELQQHGHFRSEVRQLTTQLEATEQQAADYNDQVTELTVKLREVMEGEFGLSEAVAEIKECQRQVGVRDRQVAEQNSYINLVQRHLTELVDENTGLRSRLGMEPHEAADLVANNAGKEKLVHVLEREVEKLEEERIALKLENRKLSRQLISGGQAGLSPDEIRDICRQRKEFWEYVRRLGPAVSAVKVAAPSLEALLQAMDTRSLVGQFHSALVPYSMLQQLEGKNDELRNQLRAARAELRGASALDDHGRDGQQARAELETLRQKFAVFRHQMGLLYRQRAEDADKWQAERRQLEQQHEEASSENQQRRGGDVEARAVFV